MLALLATMLFVAGLPPYYAQLRVPCEGEVCLSQQLAPKDLESLGELGISAGVYAAYSVALAVLFTGLCFALAAAIVWRASESRMALLAGLMLVLFGLAFPETPRALEMAHPGLSWLLGVVGFLGFSSVALFVNVFPKGRFEPRWTRWAAALWVLAIGQGVFLEPAAGTWPSTLNTLAFLGAAGVSLGALVYRYRNLAGRIQRQQIKWVVFGIATALAGSLLLPLLGALFPASPLYDVGARTVQTLLLLAIPLGIAIAILRYRLWDIDLIINRTLVYGALTAIVVGIYVMVVGYLGAVFQAGGNLAVSLLATGVVAVLFAPLRERLQRAVNRLMYGERDDPYRVISRLGQRLEATLAPQDVLPTIVETIREALKLPYAAMALKKGDEITGIAAAAGKPVAEPLRLPLLYRNEPIGEFLLGPRTGEEDFSAADRRLLEDLARQTGAAAHAVRLTNDLQRSRERLVTAREEERRRLRRDLHDGLGAQLAGLNVQTGVLRNLIRRDPEAADELVVELREELRAAISDIRRLVYDLRPPALDEMGLGGALHRLAERHGAEDAGLRVSVAASKELPPLHAAVEVALYRIAQEALTNVVRHARAHECMVCLAVADGEVSLEVTDDGAGLPEGWVAGVGLTSMKERAAELGGECVVEPALEGGTRVLVRLPLSRED